MAIESTDETVFVDVKSGLVEKSFPHHTRKLLFHIFDNKVRKCYYKVFRRVDPDLIISYLLYFLIYLQIAFVHEVSLFVYEIDSGDLLKKINIKELLKNKDFTVRKKQIHLFK